MGTKMLVPQETLQSHRAQLYSTGMVPEQHTPQTMLARRGRAQSWTSLLLLALSRSVLPLLARHWLPSIAWT